MSDLPTAAGTSHASLIARLEGFGAHLEHVVENDFKHLEANIRERIVRMHQKFVAVLEEFGIMNPPSQAAATTEPPAGTPLTAGELASVAAEPVQQAPATPAAPVEPIAPSGPAPGSLKASAEFQAQQAATAEPAPTAKPPNPTGTTTSATLVKEPEASDPSEPISSEPAPSVEPSASPAAADPAQPVSAGS